MSKRVDETHVSAADDDDYETVAYEGHSNPGMCPEHLLRTSWLFGGPRPRLDAARVLEIGCGDGANVVALAYHWPRSTFVGLDRSARHVAFARESVAALGLSNCALHALDVRDVSRDVIGEEPFDYVLCHGVLSWVADDVRDAILALCRAVLAPEGLACVSYNAFPGWRVRGLVRELLLRKVDPAASPMERARAAKAHAAALADHAPDSHPYGQLLARELRIVVEAREEYLVHEYLAPVNRAYWLRDFVGLAAAHDLAYVGEASFNRPDLQPQPTIVEAIAALAPSSHLEREETLDVVLYRQFRSSVLCRAGATRAPHPDDDARDLAACAELALVLRAVSDPFHLADGATETFRGAAGFELDASDAALKAALLLLSSRWPAGLDLASLRAQVCAILEQHDVPAPRADALDDLGLAIVELFRGGQADVRLAPMGPPYELGDRPCACALARHEARIAPRLTTKVHVTLPLDPLQRTIIELLDGTRSTSDVTEALARSHPDIPLDTISERVRTTCELLSRWRLLHA